MPDKIGRNEPCPCGSGKKYKKCCMGKDKEQEKQQQRTKRPSITPRFAAHDKYIFDSKEYILESIRAEGYEPVATEETYDIDDEPVTTLTVELYCKHGHSEIGRDYVLRDDGKWECVEEGVGIPCPECKKENVS
jgi:uncharacterized protein YchJ